MLGQQLRHPWQVTLRRHYNAAGALNGLRNKGSNGLCAFLQYELFQLCKQAIDKLYFCFSGQAF